MKTIKITAKDILFLESENEINFCKSIPLTKEWFLKLDFNKENKDFFLYYNHNGIKYEAKENNNLCKLKDLYFAITNKELKYVHQLQKLYFVLTNEELIIT